MSRKPFPTALSVAGSDSGGGAGVQADLKAFAAFGVHGLSALTSVTAQNTRSVTAIHALQPDCLRDQLRALFDDFEPRAVKVGMLGSAEMGRVLASELGRLQSPVALIIDPVGRASSGRSLSSGDLRAVLWSELMPIATMVTPNLAELGWLVGTDLEALVTAVPDDGMGDAKDARGADQALTAAIADAASRVLESGVEWVLAKGGHLPGEACVDTLFRTGGKHVYATARVQTNNDHGTGCTLAAAIAAGVCTGARVEDAVRWAKYYLTLALRSGAARSIGHGRGPLDHFPPKWRRPDNWSDPCPEFEPRHSQGEPG